MISFYVIRLNSQLFYPAIRLTIELLESRNYSLQTMICSITQPKQVHHFLIAGLSSVLPDNNLPFLF